MDKELKKLIKGHRFFAPLCILQVIIHGVNYVNPCDCEYNYVIKGRVRNLKRCSIRGLEGLK